MAPSAVDWNEERLPFRKAGAESGLLLLPSAIGRPQVTAETSPPAQIAQFWNLRRDCLFGTGDEDVRNIRIPEIPPCTELVLCVGTASQADWTAFAEIARRVRIAHPEAVLRCEVWDDGEAPGGLDAGTVGQIRQVRPLFVHVWVLAGRSPTQPLQDLSAQFTDAGIPVAAEVLLAAAPDLNVGSVRAQCVGLADRRIRPYALVDAAWLPPAARVDPAQALELIRGLRGWISGLAVPQLVEEDRNGARAIRIPQYVVSMDESGTELVSYSGARHRYPNPPEQ